MEREFKGVWIPAEIYTDKSLCWNAKLIFIEIDSFTANDKECFISNEHLSEMLGISVVQVSKHISKLIEVGWISQTHFDGRKRYLKSNLVQGSFEPKFKADLNQSLRQTKTKVKGRLKPKFKHTNTITNTSTKPNTNYADFKKSAKEPSLKYDFKKLVEVWFEEYTNFKGTEPTFGSVEGKTLKSLASKILTKDKDSINLPENFRMILLMAQSDKWIGENFNLKIINSNFDKIYANGTKQITEERQRQQDWADWIANHRPSY